MKIKETINHSNTRFQRVFDADDLTGFREALTTSLYPYSMADSDGNGFVAAAWKSLVDSGSGSFGWSEYVRVDQEG